MSINTPFLGISELEPSQAQPHIIINEALETFDRAIAGRLVKALTGNTVLTETESAHFILEFTGTLGGTVSVTVQNAPKTWVVKNSCDQVITFNPSGGSGINIEAGQMRMLMCDGTNVVEVSGGTGSSATTGTLANTTNLGDGTSGNKILYANNGAVNKPYICFDQLAGRWVTSDDGINDAPLIPTRYIHLAMMAVYTSAQTPVFVCGEDMTLTNVEVLADKAPGSTMGVSILQIPSGMTCNHNGFKVASGATGFVAYKSGSPRIWTKGRFFLLNKTDAEKNAPKDYTWQGSNDSTNGVDGTWTTLATITGKTVRRHEWHEDIWTNAIAYTWLKLNVTAAQAGASTLELGEIEGFESSTLRTPKDLTANGTIVYSTAAATGCDAYKCFDGNPTELFVHDSFTSDTYTEAVGNISLPAGTRFYGKINGLVDGITNLEFAIKAKEQWT